MTGFGIRKQCTSRAIDDTARIAGRVHVLNLFCFGKPEYGLLVEADITHCRKGRLQLCQHFHACARPDRFRQGFGRLIRRKDDRGIVAVLDGRITSRRYGRSFVASLPPAEVVELPRHDLGAAAAEFLNA